MQLKFNSVQEAIPDVKWLQFFTERWPAYKEWIRKSDSKIKADTRSSLRALREYMPEMVETHQNLCHLVNADEEMIRFLSGFQPPPYYNACSQAVTNINSLQLIRNYDYHPDQNEATIFLTSWHGKKVMVNSDSLIGAIDGMNEEGLVVSLTFGGRKVVGPGFGIPFILRYVLEFCNTLEDATEVLCRIPSHMSYNVTVADKSGQFKTILMAPDRDAIITDSSYATNHQNEIEWPENALFNKTFERSEFLEKLLSDETLNDNQIIEAFLKKPLYHKYYKQGLGTIYTAIYKPREGKLRLLWPEVSLEQSFYNFSEKSQTVQYHQAPLEKNRKKAKGNVFKKI